MLQLELTAGIRDMAARAQEIQGWKGDLIEGMVWYNLQRRRGAALISMWGEVTGPPRGKSVFQLLSKENVGFA